MQEAIHIPVFLEEAVGCLQPSHPGALFLDCTVGEGGHAMAFLERFPQLRYIGIDRDEGILRKARTRLEVFADRVHLIAGWFDEVLAEWPSACAGAFPGSKPKDAQAGLFAPDMVLFDLGISMYHYKESGRGFALRTTEALDMRLSGQEGVGVAELLAKSREAELLRIFREYGEEPFAGRIARTIVETRKASPIRTSDDLADLVWRCIPAKARYRAHGPRIHPATRVFQALRIAVNDELARLERALPCAFRILAEEGILSCITFHSLEDRIVKQHFARWSRRAGQQNPIINKNESDLIGRLLFKKAVKPQPGEVESNPASRSAKFRAIARVKSIS